MRLVKSSYKEDVVFLLKDLSEEINEITVEEKEKLINSGINYSEFISKESIPSKEMTEIFLSLLEDKKEEVAKYVEIISDTIFKEKGENLVIVSLARAGTPFGILIKKYIKFKYKIDIPHYSISIIRGKGIDFNALKFILKEHKDGLIQFVDGWTGKGSITKELDKSIELFNREFGENVSSGLAAIADPAMLCTVCGTRKDIAIPNCCLNSTVSGLISRTIHNDKYINEDDFHGAKYLDYLEEYDFSNEFIKKIEECFKVENYDIEKYKREKTAEKIVQDVREEFDVADINKIKLSVGEASRALLRRKVRCILIKDIEDKDVRHIIQLSKEKDVEILKYDKTHYECIAIIK
ncbi:cysteine protease StiP domain-containing protein [Clostridium sardiniense]|uniref:cysteine protease StiP domain-containing protein n=1 Tax=Clostridium sardiniense TaxID=29369 RepID=UPI003D34F375